MSGDTYDHSMCPPWCIHMGQTCPTDGCVHTAWRDRKWPTDAPHRVPRVTREQVYP